MKKEFKKEYKVWCYAASFLILVWILAINMISNNYEKKKVEYMEAEIDSFQSKIESTLNIYEYFSQYVFEEMIANDKVLSIMKDSTTSEGEDLDKLRYKLFEILEEKFETMIRYKFNRLNFNLPNGENFLRFHMLNNYGEDISKNRKAINIADSERRSIFVFEKSGEYSGYRFIYPLYYNSDYVGTVEMAISANSLLEVFSKIYPKIDTFFLTKMETLPDRSYAGIHKNGENCGGRVEDEKFSGIQVISEKNNMVLSNDDSQVIIESVCEKFDDFWGADKSFSYFETIEGETYLINFSQVKDISERTVAYFISVAENDTISGFDRDLRTHEMIFSAAVFVLLITTLIFSTYQVKLRRISQIDHLTKIYNRHKFNEIVINEFSRFERYGNPFSILMIDIDYFKQVNDNYGHNVGDRVLKRLAKTISTNIRKSDVFARWGGEEFICLLPNTKINGAELAGEKLRSLVETTPMDKVGKITISVGVSCVCKPNDTVDKLIERADIALYNAKNTGRNKVSRQV